MLGSGLLAIWNEVDPDREDDLDAWHVHEHLPERVAIPGFLRARRYVREASPASPGRAFLTLYETESVGVMASAPYLERLDHPTPLTRERVSLLVDMRRSALRQVATVGRGVGGFLSVWAFRPRAEVAATELTDLLVDLTRPVGVIAAHAYAPEAEATRAKDATSEGLATPTRSETSRWLLLTEGVNPRCLERSRHDMLDRVAARADAADVTVEEYRLAVLLS